MTKTKFDETYIFKISMKILILLMYLLVSKFRFLELRLLLTGSLLTTVRYHQLFDKVDFFIAFCKLRTDTKTIIRNKF